MKYVLEFGVRGGAHSTSIVLPTRRLALRLAAKLAYVFDGASTWEPTMRANCPREAWQNSSHFVSITRFAPASRIV